MGAKGVKVIVIDPAGGERPKPADPARFKAGAHQVQRGPQETPAHLRDAADLRHQRLTGVINEAGGLPTRNFSSGYFEGADGISGETQHDTIVERGGVIAHACHRGCTIRCCRIYVDENGQYLTKGPEYETVWAHGTDCGISDLDAVARMDRMDDDFGIDTIETGATIAVAMEAGILPFGDAPAAIELLSEVGKGSPLGRLVASGAEVLGKTYGVRHIPTVKGQSMPAYDPRAVLGIGVTYATSPMGADHTAGYAVAANILGVGGKVDPLKPEGQVELSRNLQIATAAIDAAGLCLFTAFAVPRRPSRWRESARCSPAGTGGEYSLADFLELGKRTLLRERRFNAAAGFHRRR